MTRRGATLLVLGIAAYAAFLVGMLPARVVTSHVALPPGLALRNVEGSVWNGQASVSWQAAGASLALDAVRWRWRPLALLSGRMAYDVSATGRGLDAQARIARGFGAWTVEDLQARGDVSSIALAVPLASAWQPSGRIEAKSASLTWNGRELEGKAEARWSDAALALSSVRPLGNYVLRLDAAGGPARVTLATTDGPLRLSGDGTLEGLERLAFTGEARAEGPQAAALSPLLDLFGPRRPDGSRALRYP